MISAVFDTNIYLQAAVGKGGPAHECWRLVLKRVVEVYVSPGILAEVEDVLTRPKLRRQFSNLTPVSIDNLLKRYRYHATLIDSVNEVVRLHRDQADEKFINLAVQANVNYLVTRDHDLLDLRDDLEFSSQFPRLNIVTPVGFLEAVRAA